MDSAYLLVIDDSPENAEQINSLLRNSGIIVHILFAKDITSAVKAIKSTPPFLLIHNASAPQSISVAETLHLADQHDLEAVIRVSPDAPDLLIEALAHDFCIAVNADDERQLEKVVRQKLLRGKSSLDQAGSLEKLDELEHRYHLLLDSAKDSVAYIVEGLHVYANNAYLESMQVKNFREISGLSLLELMQGEDIDLKNLFRDMSKGKLPDNNVSVTVTNPAGTEFKADLSFSPSKYEGESCIQMVMQAKDPNAILKEELERLRHMDQLTQMVNRKTFTEQLAAFIEENSDRKVSSATIYLEPDNIQGLQEDLGVAGMDSLVADLAQIIKSCINEGDLPARFSDYGFAILVRGSDHGKIMDTVNCIVQSFGGHVIEQAEKTISASCSAGMATVGSLTKSGDEAMSHALIAFSEAAQSGNCLVRYKPQLVTVTPDEEDQQWVERIRFALNNQELYSIQQSIVNLEGDSEGLFENRTYMREESGDRPPEEFLPAAEKNDLASTIDRQVIPGLLKAISGSGDRHIINLSSNSVLDFSFPSWFEHQLEELDVQGSQVVLQISAETAESNLKPTRRLIDELVGRGCAFSISNFDDQKGICKLLEQLDVSMVKLRTGLAQGITNNQDQLEAVRNVVAEANSAKALVIADEVQDAADLAVLWQCGVKLVAGEFLKESPQVVGQ